jgi:uncharacterized membrane protein
MFVIDHFFQTGGTPAADQATDPVWLDTLKIWTGYLATGVEICAAIIIGIAAIEAIIAALFVFISRNSPPEAKEDVRLRLGRWLAVALEFGLAADILRTAVAPSWTEIGQLVVIAFLRTALNFFLQQEIDRATVRDANPPPVSSQNGPAEPDGIKPASKAQGRLSQQVTKAANPGNPFRHLR